MYQKALLFSDHDSAAKILLEKNPKKNKELGRAIKNFNTDLWEQHRDKIVEEGSYSKYMYSLHEKEDLKAMLLATGDRRLVEASPFDRIWGVGYGEREAKANQRDWGLNLLGKALMRARERIRQDHKVLDKAEEMQKH